MLTQASAAVYSVSGTGLADIISAMVVANDGDVISVQPGTYLGCTNQLTFGYKYLTIIGNGSTPADVVIDCQQNGYVVKTIAGIKGGSIENLTIKNTLETSIILSHDVPFSLRSTVITNSKQKALSMVMTSYSPASSLTLDNCLISNNAKGGIKADYVDVVMRFSRVSNHACTGIWIGHATVSLIDSFIIDNVVTSSIEPVAGVYGTNVVMEVNNTVISHNSMNCLQETLCVGGIYVGNGSKITLYNSTISNNMGGDSSTMYGSGGMVVRDGDGYVYDSMISGNIGSATGGGGGLLAYYSSIIVHNTMIRDNVAFNGGGIKVDHGTMTMAMCSLINNTADGDCGGSIGMYASTLYMNDTLLTHNTGHYGT